MGRVVSSVRSGLAALVTIAAAGLVVLHLWLFISAMVDGRVFDPIVAVRWAVGVVLVCGLVALQRAGIPLTRSRQAAVVWVLVALLHASISGGPQPSAETATGSGGLVVIVVLPATAAGALATVRFVLHRAGTRNDTARVGLELRRLWLLSGLESAATAPGHILGIAPRAPPRLSLLASAPAL